MTYGVTSTGYNIKTLKIIRDEIREEIINALGNSANVVPPSVLGNLIDIISDREHDLWELNQAVYNSAYPTATGLSLDLVAKSQGKIRRSATYSKVIDFTLTFSSTATVPAGSTFTDGTADSYIWELDEDVTYTGAGGTATGTLTCTTSGANNASIDTITTIVTPVANLTSVTNPNAAVAGNDLETDAELRARIFKESVISEISTQNGIRKAIMDLNTTSPEYATILSCYVIENDTNVTDADGRPPKSIEVLVYYDGCVNPLTADAARDSQIIAAIASTKPEGIQIAQTTTNYYQETGVEMAGGTTRTITYSQPDDITINVKLTLTTTSDYPTDGDDQIETLVQEYFNSLNPGDDCVAHGYGSLEATVSTVPGVTDIVIDWAISPASPSGDTNITIDYDEIAVYGTIQVI